MHVSLSVESYAASPRVLRGLGELLAGAFPSYSLAIEADIPPHRTVGDLCTTARVLEAAGIPFGLDGPWVQADPGHLRRRRILTVEELGRIHEAAPRQLKWVRIGVGPGSPTTRPVRFADVLGFCRDAGLGAQVVVSEVDWGPGGWARLARSRGPSAVTALHGLAVASPMNPPRFLVTGCRRGDLTAWGYSLELGRGFPYGEADLHAVLDVIERNMRAGATLLNVYPPPALVDGLVALPPHLHAWPGIDADALLRPGHGLRLTELGQWLAEHAASGNGAGA
ncbi:MAG TPA: hypothetical protein PLD23_01215 [Armatimonadota bacterium]|nr:hypothetical protein [Armatimonadota bacterium]HQK92089.1 hypothetical protein [Armatimonadota bacterium]